MKTTYLLNINFFNMLHIHLSKLSKKVIHKTHANTLFPALHQVIYRKNLQEPKANPLHNVNSNTQSLHRKFFGNLYIQPRSQVIRTIAATWLKQSYRSFFRNDKYLLSTTPCTWHFSRFLRTYQWIKHTMFCCPPGSLQEIFLKILNVKFVLTGSAFSAELYTTTVPRN